MVQAPPHPPPGGDRVTLYAWTTIHGVTVDGRTVTYRRGDEVPDDVAADPSFVPLTESGLIGEADPEDEE